jgi:hypothetical protein
MNTQGKGGLLFLWLLVASSATGLAASLYRLRSSTSSSDALNSNTQNLEAPEQRPDQRRSGTPPDADLERRPATVTRHSSPFARKSAVQCLAQCHRNGWFARPHP